MTKTILFFLCLACFGAGAQTTNSLTGKVTDPESRPLSGVNVHLLNTNFGSATDQEGVFTITGIPLG
ncbi:MAG: carboxypeptidase-like regulatory domain-containing protein, partial [Cyclobacteriaceae bacterium]|nr:carboxypeptidase-like regulatory domain-containing protein [Cyclobacteriaceae bacterium]